MRHAGLAAALACLAALAPASALAFQRELQLGVDLGYAHELEVEDGAGGAAGLHLRYGVTDAIGLTFALLWSGHPRAEGEPSLRNVATAAAGFVYALDVLRLVPYFGVMVGAAVRAEDRADASFLVRGHAGFDFLFTRDVSAGLDLSAELLVGELVGPARVVAAVRVSWHRLL